MSVARWIVTVLALGLLGAPLVIAVAALSGIGHRWVDILAQFTAPALMGVIAFAAVLLIARLWIAGGGAVAVGLLLLLAVWPQWSPPSGRPQPGAPVLTMYSANLHVLNSDVAAMKASIDAADADVVVLIEMSRAASANVDLLLADYPHRVATPRLDRESDDRTVIASRYPVTRLRGGTQYPGLASLSARIDTPIGPVNVVGVHLTRPWPYQYQWGQITQVMGLTEVIGRYEGPVLVAGDFNSVSSARIGKQVRADIGLTPAPGWPGTWPSRLPAALGITIDQVYHSPDLAVLDRRLGRRTGSDHRSVVTRFTLAASPPAP